MENDTDCLRRTFPGGSELAGRMRALDWSATALGSPQGWPEPLKFSVSLCVTSKFPIVMFWGPDRNMVYNDPYIQFLGKAKHPLSLGRPAREAWSDAWDALDPLFERVQRTAEATSSADFPLFVSRDLPNEEVYITFTMGPILSAAGTVDGFFCPCTDVTDMVVGERRLETLRKLAVAAMAARTTDAACETASTVLAENPHDVPFAAIYVVSDDGARASLKSVGGFPHGENPFPGAAAVADVTASPWPLAAALRSRRAEDTQNLVEADVTLPGGPWPEPSSRAVVLPIFAQHGILSGLVVLGVGPRRVLDDAYRTFFGLVAAHIGTALSNARTHEAAQNRADALADALRGSQDRFRSYFELGLIGMAVIAPGKGFLEVNDGICRILGYERDELLHKTWAELTHPDDLAADLRQFNRVMAGEIDGYSLDKRWIRKDGAIIDATISVKCVRTAGGAVDYFVALLQDITERTRTNEALTRARDDLERRVAERTERLSELNHGLLRLHEFSTHQPAEADLRQILNDALVAMIAMHGADFGSIQLYRHDTAILEIVAHHGFGQEFLDYFNAVADDSSACGRAHQRQQRVIIEDVQTDPGFAPHRTAAAPAGFRAVQSTPIASRSGEPLGIISTHFRQPHRPSDEALRVTDLFAQQLAKVIERKQSEAAVLEYQRELQDVMSRLIDAQETANRYVARELHDVFSQELAVIGRNVAALERRSSQSPASLATSLREITEQIHSLADDLHRMSRRIHPAILYDLGLSAAIRSECLAFSDEHHTPVDFQADDIRPGVPEPVALCLYRVAQEALRNVGKHAGASSVRVSLRLTTTGLALTIEDTGKGFDVDGIAGKRGLGLVSMEERLRMVRGTLTIRSIPGDGTSVVATVPLTT